MLRRTAVIVAALLGLASAAAQTSASGPHTSDNPELTRIFSEDQRVRQPQPIGPNEAKITRTDADRLARVKEMLLHDQVHSTADYLHAALVLQHSLIASDYLVAHSLAVLCAADRDKTCLWLSAATLDRYLQSVGQPQIYGTQYVHFDHPPVTQKPYTEGLFSDSIRKDFGVPTLREQQEQLADFQKQVASKSQK